MSSAFWWAIFAGFLNGLLLWVRYRLGGKEAHFPGVASA